MAGFTKILFSAKEKTPELNIGYRRVTKTKFINMKNSTLNQK